MDVDGVYVFPTRNGRICEMFDPDDEAGSVRALCRRAGGDEADGPVAALVGRLVDAFAARDWERVRDCFAPDLHTVDHRRVTALALDAQSGDGVVERTCGVVALAADARPTGEVIAELDGIGMVRIAWSGHLDDGGGPFELTWRGVIVTRDDVVVRYELFDAEDESGMLAAVARLRAGGHNAITG